MKRRTPLLAGAVVATVAAALLPAAPSSAQPTPSLDELLIPDGPVVAEVEPSLFTASGTVTVSLELTDPSLAEAAGEDAKQKGSRLSRAQQRRHVDGLERKQRALAGRAAGLGATEVAATQKASNLLVVEVEAERIPELAADPEVTKILPVVDFEVDLAETVPHIGGTALQEAAGLTGDGVSVAVFDTGIDYTHAALGGEGTQEAYLAAYGESVDDPTNTDPGEFFPTDKVVGGYDFVGEFWPTGDLNPNPDPIDCGSGWTPAPCTGGHGTNVADIIAGELGVAPDADLYAYKVCSSIASSCSGVAILQAFEAALDPLGTGDIADAVDVINLSLGANYGLIENPASGAAANAARLGVTVVASAGNGGDKPYVAGSPSSTPEVIAVAQTQVPSALHYNLAVTEPADAAEVYGNTNPVAWAPITDGFDGELWYGESPAERVGCFVDGSGASSAEETGVSPYPAGSLEGLVVLIDRGVCNISYKTHNAAEAGAVGVIIANNQPGLAPSFSFGGPDPFAEQQTLIVGLDVGDALRAALAGGEPVVVSVDADNATPLTNSMVATSSRGPSNSEIGIKPDVGAPGASLSAVSGSGTGTRAFGGTSGAAPMVAGAVALLLEAYPDRTPLEIKAVLMNTAETEIYIQPALQPGDLAEITRIGGGEIRVDRAHASGTAAWSQEDSSAGLSFGYHRVNRQTVLRKEVTVHNYSDKRRTYTVTPEFRYADDAASKAVSLTVPPRVVVGPGRSATVPVMMRIDPKKLPDWQLDGGPNGANGPLLRENEFDGYLRLSGGGDDVHLPWHVLPHRASDVKAPKNLRLNRSGAGTINLVNPASSGLTATAEVFALTGTSPRLPADAFPGEGDGFAVADLAAAGVRTAEDTLQFAVNTYGRQAHPNAPIGFQVELDVTGDGEADYLVFNRDLAQPQLTDGRNVVYVQPVGGAATAYYFVEAGLNSGNTVLTVPLAAVGLAEGDQFTFSVYAVDYYFTSAATDGIEDMTFTVGTPRFTSASTVEVPAKKPQKLAVNEVSGGAEASPSQTGLLLLWADGVTDAHAVTVR